MTARKDCQRTFNAPGKLLLNVSTERVSLVLPGSRVWEPHSLYSHFYPFMPTCRYQTEIPRSHLPLIALNSSSWAPFAWKHILDPISLFSHSSPSHEPCGHTSLMTYPCKIPGISCLHAFVPAIPLPGIVSP